MRLFARFTITIYYGCRVCTIRRTACLFYDLMVIPAGMLTKSLFPKASCIPGSLRIVWASCGLQLRCQNQLVQRLGVCPNELTREEQRLIVLRPEHVSPQTLTAASRGLASVNTGFNALAVTSVTSQMGQGNARKRLKSQIHLL
jgi:hypothetical protein